jgi:hypothetical protein
VGAFAGNPATSLQELNSIEWETFRTLLGMSGGTVTRIGMLVDAPLQVSPAAITASGDFDLSWIPQSLNKFFLGPASGADAAPAFRPVTTADLGVGGGLEGTNKYLSGALTWLTLPAPTPSTIGLTPATYFMPGADVTGSGNLSFAWVDTIGRDAAGRGFVLAGPTAAGSPTSAPTFRAVVGSDLGASPDSTKVLWGDMTWRVPPAGGGGTLTGGGAPNTIAMWTEPLKVENSVITQNATGDISMTGHLTLTGAGKYVVSPKISISETIVYGPSVLPFLPGDSIAGKLWAITGQGAGVFAYTQFLIPGVPDVRPCPVPTTGFTP